MPEAGVQSNKKASEPTGALSPGILSFGTISNQ